MSTPDAPQGHVPPVPIPPVATPQAPRYGEYASPEHQAAAQQPAAPVYQQPTVQHPGYAQQQPYGQPAYGQQPYYGQAPAGPRPMRVGDVVASAILLGIGFFSMLIAILNAFTIDMQMEIQYEAYGVDGTYESGAAGAIAAAVIIISHVLLYTLAVIFTIVLIRRRKLSFWVPLVAGAVASVVFFATFIALVVADPNLMDVLISQS